MNIPPIKTHPLKQMTLEEAVQMQFKLVDIIGKYFNGKELVRAGDFGHPRIDVIKEGVLTSTWCHPEYTIKVEKVLAEFFGAKEATLVWGGGSGAFHRLFIGALNPGDKIILDDTNPYPTVFPPIRAMDLRIVRVDMDNPNELKKAIDEKTKAVWITHANFLKDYYAADVISVIKSTEYDPLIMVDENYVAMRVDKIGIQLGADISTFSLYKLLGPANVGVILGAEGKGAKVVEQIRRDDVSSAGLMVQGPDAMGCLKHIALAPVMLAIHKNVVDEICERLNKGEVNGVDWAVSFSAPSLTAYVKLKEPIAKKVYEVAPKYGSYDRPIGAEGIDEITFRISYHVENPPEKLRKYLPNNYCITLRPYRAGPATCLNALRKCIEEAKKRL